MADDTAADGFWRIHDGLPREGPGSPASTRRALDLSGIGGRARVVDVGFGPGPQSLVLAEAMPDAEILAVDAHEPFVAEVRRRAADAGGADRVTAVVGDMADLGSVVDRHVGGPVDLIWSEGAAYVMGFEAALRTWHPVLGPGGVLALTEPVWLAPTVPQAVRDFWDEAYPALQPLQVRRAQALHAGYRRIGDFVLPREDWDAYYEPVRARLAELREDPARIGPALADAIAATEAELAAFDGGGAEAVGYAFLVLRRDG